MIDEESRTYRVRQLVHDERGTRNEDVTDPDGLVTHHPVANRNASMRDGVILGTEDLQPNYRRGDRSYAYISGDYQEIIDTQVDAYRNLKPNQVLVVKDFILEDPLPPGGAANRAVDVPSPVAGYVSQVRAGSGMVEIMDREGGDVVARIRHMSGIPLAVGDTVEYGERLGTQNNLGLPATAGKHVHLEMDTRYYQQYKNYISDLTDGRLPVQATLREGVAALPVINDNIARLGESSDRVRDAQHALIADGYRAAGNQPIVADGIYRPELQGAMIAFQQDHGLRQTGDIDVETWQQARHINRQTPLGPVALNAPERPRFDLPVLDEINARQAPERVAGDPRYGLDPPPDPARTGRQPLWTEHAVHTLPHELAQDRQQRQQRPEAADPAEGPLLNPAAPRMPNPPGRGGPDRNDPDRPDHDRDRPQQPPRRGAQLMTDPDHVAHPAWQQAERAMRRAAFDPDDRLTPEQRERATAAVAAGVLVDTRTNLSRIDHIHTSTIADPQTGLPKYLIAGQGDPTTDYYRRVPVEVTPALNTPVEQSSDVAKTATQTREQISEQRRVQELAQAQTINQDVPGGPTMRIGARSPGGDTG